MFSPPSSAAETFRAAWVAGLAGSRPSAPTIDAVLHRERLHHRIKRLHSLTDLPDGAMIAAGGEAFPIVGGRG